jgi:hypothetical protein
MDAAERKRREAEAQRVEQLIEEKRKQRVLDVDLATMTVRASVHASVHACVRACVRSCMRASVHACGCADVRACVAAAEDEVADAATEKNNKTR